MAHCRKITLHAFCGRPPTDCSTTLSIDRSDLAVLAHGGAIMMQTEVGRGTTFEVLLPAVPADPDDGEEETRHQPKGRGQRIAFVDDEPSITLMAERRLTRQGYTPQTFDRAQALLDHLATPDARSDLIITDHTMPGMTGL